MEYKQADTLRIKIDKLKDTLGKLRVSQMKSKHRSEVNTLTIQKTNTLKIDWKS